MMSVRASNAAWLVPGCRLDRYDLLLQVAEGGMGLLWLARQQGKHGFDKIVAIKTILPRLASDVAFRRMFLDEARVVSRIEHPNVAQVLDLGEERGVLFLVMKWIDGESLINLGRAVAGQTKAQIPVGILARIMVDACAGLHAAHELTDDDGLALSVVHRDVSPHNLLIGFRGTTKVIDFGIAKARNRMAQDTSIGLLKGKVAYMAPEQAMGNQVDRRTDVWSAGASMYRFLAGRVPYDAAEPLGVLRRITEGLPPTPLPKTVPEAIRLVVERALEPDAGERFETAHDMGAALETAMHAAGMYTTREDVAAFLAEHMGAARAARTREIEHAVRESRARMRAELAHTESASGLALPTAQKDRDGVSSSLDEERSDEALDLAGGSGEPPRPSRRPTVATHSDEHPRGSDRPTAVLPTSQGSIGTCEVPQPAPQEPIEAAQSSAGAHAGPDRLAPTSLHRPRRAPRALARWVAGACLLGALLAGGLALRVARNSHSIGAAVVAVSPIRSVTAPGVSSLPPSDTSPIQAPVSTLDPAAPPLVPTAPSDPHAPAIPSVEPSVPDRGPSDNLLERARHARRAGRIGEAAALFAAAVERAPLDSVALTDLGEVDDAQGLTGEAIVHYRRALAINPRYLPARLGLADSLWTGGQRGEARTAYRSIVDEVPTTLCPDLARERAAGNAGNERTPR